ncbi:MAG TPA: GLPGLI family protein [Saprospiraceae bacterium]|nr:GLPGLI family protein [Saprospiraceae bacterium]
MRKIGFLIIFMVFGWQHLVFGQSITVYYDWVTDFPVAEMVKHGQSREKILAINKHARPRKYSYKDGYSVYQTLKMTSDTIRVKAKVVLARQFVEPYFYKDFLKGTIHIIDMKNDSTTATEIGMEGFGEWRILSDTTTILGHLCKKAVLEKNGKSTLSAWYALDIPIMDGPEQYFGLPGLILKLRAQGSWIIRASRIEEGRCDEFLQPTYSKLIDYREYIKRRKLYGRGGY